MSPKPNKKRHANQPRNRAPAQAQSPAKRATPTVSRPTQPPLPLAQEYIETTIEYSGPLPPADQLARYDEVVPGLAAEIVEMAHDEQRFRHRIVEKAVDANIASEKRGQRYALIIAIIGFVAGVVIALFANAAAGASVSGASLAAIVGLFLKARRDEKRDDNT